MPRVAGTDPGTSSLDILVLENNQVEDQVRFTPEQLQADPEAPATWLQDHGPLDLITGPSGYGLPLVAARDCTDKDLDLMALVRPKERGQGQGVLKFLSVIQALIESSLPLVFLPGVIHLPTVPLHRKINRIDLGTADKLCVATLALAQAPNPSQADFCLVELGSAFTACLVVQGGKIVDGLGGTSGPPGWTSCGAWDGEVAYWLSPLAKRDLFQGGLQFLEESDAPYTLLAESLRKAIAGLQSVTPFQRIILSGRLLEHQPELRDLLSQHLSSLAPLQLLDNLPGAWVKHAAQGAALLADGLAGGSWSGLVSQLQLRQSSGTILDYMRHPKWPRHLTTSW